MSSLSTRLATLPAEHRAALNWFNDRRGELIGRPGPVGNVFVFNPQTGIQKPAGWKYAVSVRQTLTSAYDDHPPVRVADGSWTYRYFQERLDPEEAAKIATNRGLLACLEDDVPVAVMIQEKPKPGVLYRVWGLAKVLRFSDGYFLLQGYNNAGELTGQHLEPALAYQVPLASYPEVAESSDLVGLEDARRRIEAQIYVRQGGGKFRDDALNRFEGRCVVSECEVPQVLEAAHIVPYRGPHTNTADNALLMRGDIHTLFDRNLLRIDPETLRIELSEELKQSAYSEFDGRTLVIPATVSRKSLGARLLERLQRL